MSLGKSESAHNAIHVEPITGLRAIAVAAVVMYHLNSKWMPGGFVGVDVFFVISGFVVAHSVLGRPANSYREFLVSFYRRRLTRIFPAALVYIASAALMCLLFIPLIPSTKLFELTGAAATVGLSNMILYIGAGGYFSISSEFNPFTHTWSLAVEEQYYVIFSLFFYYAMINDRLRKFSIIIISVFCVLSLMVAALTTTANPTFAFYMLPSRLWELGLGLLLRLAISSPLPINLSKQPHWLQEGLAASALAVLLLTCVTTDPTSFPFPGAILPCLSTATLIALAWSRPDSATGRLLSNPIMVWIGNVSYSLYLWHWGVIVFMRWTVGLESFTLQFAALAMTLILSALSYYFIEQLVQRRERSNPRQWAAFLISFSCAIGTVAVMCGIVVVTKPILGMAAANNTDIWSPVSPPPMANCPTRRVGKNVDGGNFITFASACKFTGPRIFVIGDSHAGAYLRMFWSIAARQHREVYLYTLGGCRLVGEPTNPPVPRCDEFMQSVLAQIKAHGAKGDVVFIAGLQTPRFAEELPEQRVHSQSIWTKAAIVHSRAIVEGLTSYGFRVILEAPKPVMRVALYRCADWFNKGSPYCKNNLDVSATEEVQRMTGPRAMIQLVAKGDPRITIWDPSTVLCNLKSCPSYVNGKPLYSDSDHLSGYANDLLKPSFDAAVSRALAGP